MKLRIGGIERYCESVGWEGCYNSVIRTVRASVYDDGKAFASGDPAELYDGDGKRLFTGMVTTTERADDERLISVTAEDGGIRLKRNKTSVSFSKASPSAVVKKLSGEFGIPLGKVVSPKGSLTRNFYGADLYAIIMTAYTKAADGKKFFYPHFDGDGNFCVTELQEGGEPTLSHYQSARYSESIREMVNVVNVYDKDNRLVTSYKDAADLKKYGQFAEYFKKAEDTDAAQAKKLLRGLEQSVKVRRAMGDSSLVTGTGVIVPSPLTKASGLFWIISDRHTWDKNGYTVDLDLSFEKLMNEMNAGSDPVQEKRKGSGSVSKSTQSGKRGSEMPQNLVEWNNRKP